MMETMASPTRTNARSFRLSNRSAMAPAKIGKDEDGYGAHTGGESDP